MGIPVYAVVTNAQLAQIAEKKPQTITALGQIEGIGQGKCEKFGAARCFEPPPSMAVLKRVSVKVTTV